MHTPFLLKRDEHCFCIFVLLKFANYTYKNIYQILILYFGVCRTKKKLFRLYDFPIFWPLFFPCTPGSWHYNWLLASSGWQPYIQHSIYLKISVVSFVPISTEEDTTTDNDTCIYAVVNKANKRKYRELRAQLVRARNDASPNFLAVPKCAQIRRSHSATVIPSTDSLNNSLNHQPLCASNLHLANFWQCSTCSLINSSTSDVCFGCETVEGEVLRVALCTRDKMSMARCKNCSPSRNEFNSYTSITPVEQPPLNNANLLLQKYDDLFHHYGTRKTLCNCSHPNMISLSNISTFNCVPSSNCDRFLGTAINTSPKRHASIYGSFRSSSNTKVSRSISNDSVTLKPSLMSSLSVSTPIATSSCVPTTWTCSNCTLVNTSTLKICEACETPHRLDVNKNTPTSKTSNSNGVLIKVDNWDDKPHKPFNLPEPSYRRSLSEIPQVQLHKNRRSLGDGILEAATNSSSMEYPIYAKHTLNRMCNSISSNLLGGTVPPPLRPSSVNETSISSKPLYSYIGISEPSSNQLYENHSVLKETKIAASKEFKSSPVYSKRVQESMYVTFPHCNNFVALKMPVRARTFLPYRNGFAILKTIN